MTTSTQLNSKYLEHICALYTKNNEQDFSAQNALMAFVVGDSSTFI